MKMRPAVFFDRDGVVNVSPGSGYVLRAEDFHLSPGITEILAWCRKQGFYLVLVTSQQGVGKGLMTADDLDKIHQLMQDQLRQSGAEFDRIHACTHLAGHCTCRKPSPQMILDAAAALPIDLAASALVGDHDRDIGMARRAKVGFAVRLAGEDNPVTDPGDVLAASLDEVFEALKSWHRRKPGP